MRLILFLIVAVAISACAHRDDAFDAAMPQHDAWVTCMVRKALPLITSKIDPAAVADIAVASCIAEESAFSGALATVLGSGVATTVAATERKRLWGVVAAMVADGRS